MFLNIQKIGKTKHKYKGKITFIKIANQATQKGVCFKMKLQRGSNQVQALSQPSRKGVSKFKAEQYVIPMTLFFDEEQSKYLPKQMILKAYESTSQGKEIRKIGTVELNISEYTNQGKLKMQVQLDPQKSKDSPTLTLQIFLQRQEDDSKSVGTTSNNSDVRKNLEDTDKDKQKNKQKTQKNSSYKTSQQSKPKKNLYAKRQYETELSANQSSQNRIGIKNTKPITLKKRQDDRQKSADYGDNSSKHQKNTLSQLIDTKYPKSEQEAYRSKTIRDGKHQTVKPKNQVIQQVQEMEASLKKKISNKNNPQTQFPDGESPDLQVFLLKKALKQKQSDINNMKRQNQSLKKTIDKLIQESSSKKERQKPSTAKEVEELKKSILSKDITIDQLTTANKTLSSRQQQYQKTILKLRQQLGLTNQKISDIKYKQAFFMQSLFETANKEALQEACRFLSI